MTGGTLPTDPTWGVEMMLRVAAGDPTVHGEIAARNAEQVRGMLLEPARRWRRDHNQGLDVARVGPQVARLIVAAAQAPPTLKGMAVGLVIEGVRLLDELDERTRQRDVKAGNALRLAECNRSLTEQLDGAEKQIAHADQVLARADAGLLDMQRALAASRQQVADLEDQLAQAQEEINRLTDLAEAEMARGNRLERQAAGTES